MNLSTLTRRSLSYFWRTHAAVVVGVATSVAVLTGALLVGDSVRGSLRDLVALRLGATDQVVISTAYFRETLADAIASQPEFVSRFDADVPLILTQGFVRTQTDESQAGPVQVYGVDERFWAFHGETGIAGPEGRAARVSPALADALGLGEGDTILVRLQRPTDMPIESVFGEKDDVGRTVRASVETILPREALGEFSLRPTQGDILAVFLPLGLLQDELDVGGRANAILVSGDEDPTATSQLEDVVRSVSTPEDLGLRFRVVGSDRGPGAVALESDSGLLPEAAAMEAQALGESQGVEVQPILTWLATTIGTETGEIPYGLVTATDLGVVAPGINLPGPGALPPIVLNDVAAADLRATPGETVHLEFFVWEDPGRLVTSTADFFLAGIVPIGEGDADLAPRYPGISESPDLVDWDPPFPVDLGRIRPPDEDYWDRYRTTPRAFIPLATGQSLWGSRHGRLTSIRFRGTEAPETLAVDLASGLAQRVDPLAAGLTVAGVRASGLAASQGAVNFGEYFVYFSFFLVVSALLLAALFFKLSVEQRVREVGLLRAVGYTPVRVRSLFMREGLWLSLVGGLAGAVGGIAYAWLVIRALGTWWIGAVGTSRLTLEVAPISMVSGLVGGVAAALVCIWITLRGLSRVSERRLLVGQLEREDPGMGRYRRPGRVALGSALLGGLLIGATVAGWIPQAGGFFGAGALFLIACLSLFLYLARRGTGRVLDGKGLWPLGRFGIRNAGWRPARSVAAIAMIASAAFILVSVDAFRTEGISETGPGSGVGGYDLIVETLLPVVEDAGSGPGREALGVDPWASVRVEPFRYRPGDDASCLNLYSPQNPRIVGARASFIEAGRFRFSDSLATTPAEEANPWRLLDHEFEDGAIPVIADANSITYVLGRSLGDDILITEGDQPIRLRLVAALDDSIFQGELVMSEDRFRNEFPHLSGYSYFLVETGEESGADVQATMADALADHGARITPTLDRLAAFHQVENTYLSTFQALGALGLLLGTVGLAAILLRNVLERRQELALMRALGYPPSALTTMSLAENTLVLAAGLTSGIVCAMLAIGPAVADRGGRLPGGLLLLLLCGVLGLGLITSLTATLIALRSPLLAQLRSE